jgi:RNA polymerase sigma-70 factor (ECF subfamily)
MDFGKVWDTYRKPLEAYIRRRMREKREAEDVLQDVFLKIYTGLDGLRDEQRLRAWIFRIARHAVIDHYRKESRLAPLTGKLAESAATDEADANLNRELAACLRTLMGELPGKYREAVEWSDLEGLSQKELGDRLGMSASGARSRVQRGRRKLKELLAACCDVELDAFGNVLECIAKNPGCDCAVRN